MCSVQVAILRSTGTRHVLLSSSRSGVVEVVLFVEVEVSAEVPLSAHRH